MFYDPRRRVAKQAFKRLKTRLICISYDPTKLAQMLSTANLRSGWV